MKLAVAGGTGTVGRLVVEAARARGHDVLVLSRAAGVDLTAGTGLEEALQEVDAVLDVTSTATRSAPVSEAFFRSVTRALLVAGQRAGVGHHLVLSIVGAAQAPHGYYAGKALQERLVTGGPVPWTLLRTTQFHEFARQVLGQARIGPVDLVPVMRSAPVAAAEVADRIVDLLEAGPAGRVRDLAGPEELRMVDMVRAYARATGRRGRVLAVPLPGGFGRALRDGTVLPGPDADRGTQTFSAWLHRLG